MKRHFSRLSAALPSLSHYEMLRYYMLRVPSRYNCTSSRSSSKILDTSRSLWIAEEHEDRQWRGSRVTADGRYANETSTTFSMGWKRECQCTENRDPTSCCRVLGMFCTDSPHYRVDGVARTSYSDPMHAAAITRIPAESFSLAKRCLPWRELLHVAGGK